MAPASLFPRLRALFPVPPAEAGPVRLDARRIYVLPTRHGVLYAAFLLAMLVASINYGLALGFGFVFLLTGVGFAALLNTWHNLRGLVVAGVGATPAFAGDEAVFHLRLTAPTPREAIEIRAPGAVPVRVTVGGSTPVALRLPAPRRGRLALPRLTLATVHPLGLFRAWSHVRPDLATLVWPRPAAGAPVTVPGGTGGTGPARDEEGGGDFQGLRPWTPGDALRGVAWKAAARGGPLLSKRFAGETGADRWLDWGAVPGDPETRLSRLTRAVLDADRDGVRYGLRLPDRVLPPDRGPAHRHACLAALALFGLGDAHA